MSLASLGNAIKNKTTSADNDVSSEGVRLRTRQAEQKAGEDTLDRPIKRQRRDLHAVESQEKHKKSRSLVADTLTYPTRPYPTLPYPTLPYTLSYHTIISACVPEKPKISRSLVADTLPYPTLPYPTLPYPTLHIVVPYHNQRLCSREAQEIPEPGGRYPTLPYPTLLIVIPYHNQCLCSREAQEIPEPGDRYPTLPYPTLPYTLSYHTIISACVPEKPKKSRSLVAEILLCFSFLLSVRKVMAEGNADYLFSLNGVRVMSISWIVLGNTLSILYSTPAVLANNIDAVKTAQTVWFQALMNGTLAADSFFVLSGCLVTYHFLLAKSKQLEEKKGKPLLTPKSVVIFYVHRLMSMDSRFFSEVYVKPYCRVGAYAVGMGLGYFLNSTNRQIYFRKIYLFVANLVCAYCLAFFLITLVESPFVKLEALLRRRLA
nr:hypothetical protein BaRGS_030974 [Batillaria attramentaria]